ncbi:MAG: hypothetical protein KBC90_11765 [Spirochaetes bacterium]|nr:hypothetical protein [Spirochaetota bacterium]HOD14338.1 hypothetical protein [Spirochaetota bacterium]HPG50784.1 hypothetical protein [Spirochaetota bacterium]
MTKRKQYIIDRKYQLRTTFSIIGVVTLVTAVILGAITASVVYNTAKLNDNNSKIQNIYDIENNIFTMLSTIYSKADPATTEAMKASSDKHDRNMETLENIIAHNNAIITYNRYLLVAILFIVMFQCLLLYIILIRQTHRVSGPIYVISNFMRDIIEGRDPKLRPLRDKDELKDFYELFKEMVAAVRKSGKQ